MRSLNENWPEVRARLHHRACPCPACRRGRAERYVDRLAHDSLSPALRHAQDPYEAAATDDTQPLPPIPTEIRWKDRSGLWGVIDKVKGTEQFQRAVPGGRLLRLYRVLKGPRSTKPIYVGQVYGIGQSVGDRLRQHLKKTLDRTRLSTSEAMNLTKMIQAKLAGYFVQYADIGATRGYRLDPKFLHAMELLAQNSNPPSIYIDTVVSFEDEDDATW